MPEKTELRQTLGDLVVAAHRLTRLAARVTGSTESPATWRTLSVLQTSGAMRLGELATQSRVSQPTMTKLLDRMVRDGLVKRAQDTRDRRVVRVALTARGEMMAADLVQAAKLHETEVLARHPEAEAVAIKDLLRAIVNRQARPRRG